MAKKPIKQVKDATKRKPRAKPQPPVGAQQDPRVADFLKIKTCVNCGQGAAPIEFTAQEGCTIDQVKAKCPVCHHEWGIKEERTPHRIGL